MFFEVGIISSWRDVFNLNREKFAEISTKVRRRIVELSQRCNSTIRRLGSSLIQGFLASVAH
jgi:hypothetical protein